MQSWENVNKDSKNSDKCVNNVKFSINDDFKKFKKNKIIFSMITTTTFIFHKYFINTLNII